MKLHYLHHILCYHKCKTNRKLGIDKHLNTYSHLFKSDSHAINEVIGKGTRDGMACFKGLSEDFFYQNMFAHICWLV